MPICQIKTNYRFDADKKREFLNHLNLELADILEKPIQAIMSMLSEEYMYMNNSDDTILFAEFRYLRNFSSEEEKKEAYVCPDEEYNIEKYNSANKLDVEINSNV